MEMMSLRSFVHVVSFLNGHVISFIISYKKSYKISILDWRVIIGRLYFLIFRKYFYCFYSFYSKRCNGKGQGDN